MVFGFRPAGLRHAGIRCWRLRTFDGKACRRVDLAQLRREGPLAAVSHDNALNSIAADAVVKLLIAAGPFP